MDRGSKMITALPFFLTRCDFTEMRVLDSRVGSTVFWETCPGLTNRGQGRPAGTLREESHRRSSFCTWMVWAWHGDNSVKWKACCGKVWWICAAAQWIGPDLISQAPGIHSKGFARFVKPDFAMPHQPGCCLWLLWIQIFFLVQDSCSWCFAEMKQQLYLYSFLFFFLSNHHHFKQAIKGKIHVLMSWQTITYSPSES